MSPSGSLVCWGGHLSTARETPRTAARVKRETGDTTPAHSRIVTFVLETAPASLTPHLLDVPGQWSVQPGTCVSAVRGAAAGEIEIRACAHSETCFCSQWSLCVTLCLPHRITTNRRKHGSRPCRSCSSRSARCITKSSSKASHLTVPFSLILRVHCSEDKRVMHLCYQATPFR